MASDDIDNDEMIYLNSELGKALSRIKRLEWLNNNQYNKIKGLYKEIDELKAQVKDD